MKKNFLMFLTIATLATALAVFGQNPPGGYGPGQGSGVGTSVSGQVLYNSNGVVSGFPGLTFDGAGQVNIGRNQDAGLGILNVGDVGGSASTTITLAGAGATRGTLTNSNGVWNIGPGGTSTPTYFTATNCSSSASPAVCASAAAGSVVVAAAATTVQVNTTAVTANSQVQLTFDSSLGTKLSVTCNTTPVQPTVSARTAATSFTITVPTAPTTNPACFSYSILN